MGVAASAVQQQQGGPSGPGGSEAATGGGGAWGAGERNASSSVRYPTEASPHEPSLGGATATTASLASSLAPGSHASLGQRASGGWSHVRMSGGSHAGAGARPASDDGGATRCVCAWGVCI